MSVLRQSITARFGNLRYETHVLSLCADLGLLPSVNYVRCLLPPTVRFEAVPGDEAEIALNNGEAEADVLTGEVRSVSRRLGGIEVVAADAGAKLAAARPATTYNAMTAADIARAIASDAGANMGLVAATPEVMSVYVADQGRTAAEHVANLAALSGGLASVGADGNVSVETRPQPPASAALRYGRELCEFHSDQNAASPDVALIGFGPATAGGDPRAHLASTERIDGGADEPGASLRWKAAPVLRAPAAQRTATQEARATRGAATQGVTAHCWLLPALRPGMLIEVQDLPDGLSGGPWLLTSVMHQVDRHRGGWSRLKGVAGEAGGLLAALGGAIGVLL